MTDEEIRREALERATQTVGQNSLGYPEGAKTLEVAKTFELFLRGEGELWEMRQKTQNLEYFHRTVMEVLTEAGVATILDFESDGMMVRRVLTPLLAGSKAVGPFDSTDASLKPGTNTQ